MCDTSPWPMSTFCTEETNHDNCGTNVADTSQHSTLVLQHCTHADQHLKSSAAAYQRPYVWLCLQHRTPTTWQLKNSPSPARLDYLRREQLKSSVVPSSPICLEPPLGSPPAHHLHLQQKQQPTTKNRLLFFLPPPIHSFLSFHQLIGRTP